MTLYSGILGFFVYLVTRTTFGNWRDERTVSMILWVYKKKKIKEISTATRAQKKKRKEKKRKPIEVDLTSQEFFRLATSVALRAPKDGAPFSLSILCKCDHMTSCRSNGSETSTRDEACGPSHNEMFFGRHPVSGRRRGDASGRNAE